MPGGGARTFAGSPRWTMPRVMPRACGTIGGKPIGVIDVYWLPGVLGGGRPEGVPGSMKLSGGGGALGGPLRGGNGGGGAIIP
mmetsp:Transcript_7740/g.22933  ORF Transcript_7740/g.22933 Transcript_7740/m.22933 type:complete len:83 (+) Transcript_7740:818-1066(+)